MDSRGKSLAPTAPVEASGSERECIKDALTQSKGWPHDLHPGPAADAILALLSARPLALGGQQGVQERCQRCGGEVQGWLCQSCPAEFRENDDGHLVFDEDTTPARAEAQDEGADWPWSKPEYKAADEARIKWFHDVDANDHMGAFASAIDAALALHAHPSPTPDADADRVRIAVEALEPFANLGVTSGPDDEPCHYAYRITRGAIRNARLALDALKSTAAKEGGE